MANMPADHYHSSRLVFANERTHLSDFLDVLQNGADSDNIVGFGTKFLDEAIQARIVKNVASCIDVCFDHHESAASVKHPKGKRALNPRYLIVVQFHGVHCTTAILIVLRVGTKDAC